jgi:hypothetical protein
LEPNDSDQHCQYADQERSRTNLGLLASHPLLPRAIREKKLPAGLVDVEIDEAARRGGRRGMQSKNVI